jgi:hypothetical protein
MSKQVCTVLGPFHLIRPRAPIVCDIDPATGLQPVSPLSVTFLIGRLDPEPVHDRFNYCGHKRVSSRVFQSNYGHSVAHFGQLYPPNTRCRFIWSDIEPRIIAFRDILRAQNTFACVAKLAMWLFCSDRLRHFDHNGILKAGASSRSVHLQTHHS